MRQPLFCYGTLMEPRLMAAVIGRQARPIPATLDGYQCARLRGRDYPGLWPQADSQVIGCCYWLNHRRELARLDHYEGREYRRRRVTLNTAAGPQLGWVYLPRAGRSKRGRPWSATDFQHRALRRYLRQVIGWRAGSIAAADGGGA